MKNKMLRRVSSAIVAACVIASSALTPGLAQANLKASALDSLIYGDIDSNSHINVLDLVKLKQIITGINSIEKSREIYADLDGNGVINYSDVKWMKMFLLGMIDSFPVNENPITGDVIFASPSATDSGTGTLESPMTLEKAITTIPAGGTVYLLGGTYSFDKQLTIDENNSGSEGKMKTIKAYLNAEVTLDFSAQPYDSADTSKNARGLQLNGDYWHIYGIKVYGAADNGIYVTGNNNKIEMCRLEANRDTGLQISRRSSDLSDIADWPSYNLILNCTSYNNMDPATGENADGFAPKLTCGVGNVFDGCIAYNNVDDGWDMYAKSATGPIGAVTIQNCISFRNGQTATGVFTDNSDGNGFKLGGGGVGTPHIIKNCISFENKKHGFTDNNNPEFSTAQNITSYANGQESGANFQFDRCNSGTFINLLSYANASGTSDKLNGNAEDTLFYNSKKYWLITDKTAVANSKTGTEDNGPAASDFVSLDAPAIGADVHTLWRNADGSINTHGFLELKKTSKYYGMGADLTNGSSVPAETTTPVQTTPAETTTPATTTTPSETTPVVDDDIQSLFKLAGFGASTTGGQGGETVTVSTGSEIDSIARAREKAKSTEPITIYVNGTVTLDNAGTDEILFKDTKNVSVIGVGTNGEFSGIGIRFVRCENVIVQNMKIHHVKKGAGEGDCISFETTSNIWVDHCELYNYYNPANESEKDDYDGLLDIKKDCKNITYSWNYFHDSWKTSLCGYSDTDNYDRNITYHHNYFKDCNSRLPLFRFGHGHVYNNYYENVGTSAVNSRMGAEIYVENNVFKNVKNPVCSLDSDEIGYWNLSGNSFINCTGSAASSSDIGWSANMASTTTYKPSYSYSLTSTDKVADLVSQYSGIGKIK